MEPTVERTCKTCIHKAESINLTSTKCWDCSSFKTLIHWEPNVTPHPESLAEAALEFADKRLEYAALHEAQHEARDLSFVELLLPEEPTNALNSQVGGSHYKDLKIQPVQFIHANNIPFLEGNVIKYVCRWKVKNGIKDLEKAKHYIELLLEMEGNQDDF